MISLFLGSWVHQGRRVLDLVLVAAAALVRQGQRALPEREPCCFTVEYVYRGVLQISGEMPFRVVANEYTDGATY